MRIFIAGAPGSGKTTLGHRLSHDLTIPHFETDIFFWKNGKEVSSEQFLSSMEKIAQHDRWILEGHLGKVHHLVFPYSPVLIEIKKPSTTAFLRSLQKDSKNIFKSGRRLQSLKRIRHQFLHWKKIEKKRNDIIRDFQTKNPGRFLLWDGCEKSYSDLLILLRAFLAASANDLPRPPSR